MVILTCFMSKTVCNVSSFLIVIFTSIIIVYFIHIPLFFSCFLLFSPDMTAAAAMLSWSVLSRGITAHRLSKNVTFYMNEVSGCPNNNRESGEHNNNNKPLMLMLPWLGSRPQAVAKYCDIYFRTGFDVLVVESEVRTIYIIYNNIIID